MFFLAFFYSVGWTQSLALPFQKTTPVIGVGMVDTISGTAQGAG